MNEAQPNLLRVAINDGKTPSDAFSKGLNQLGGINQFINKGDTIFIKISLRLPYGYPTNSNFDLIKDVIAICKGAGVKKIYVGGFPNQGVALKLFETLMGIEYYFNSLGAEFVYLDNSDLYIEKALDSDKLREIKEQSLEQIEVDEKIIKFPKIVKGADKLIVVNQVNVSPLFMCDLSLVNYHSIISGKARKVKYTGNSRKELVNHNLYRQDLINNILNTYLIKKPILTVNDVFYALEGAGPLIYRDSNLKKTGHLIIGTDLIATDIVTLQFLGFNMVENSLISAVKERSLSLEHFSDIEVIGKDLEKSSIDLKQCRSRLEDINMQSFFVSSGEMCSGCFVKAYQLLNFMNTRMIKDLKYMPNHTFLVGLNPNKEIREEKVILFGDCAINSTRDYDFRTKTTKTFLKKKEKQKENKDILELPGCPPDFHTCLKRISNYFKKRNLPDLNSYFRLLKSIDYNEYKDKLNEWEEL